MADRERWGGLLEGLGDAPRGDTGISPVLCALQCVAAASGTGISDTSGSLFRFVRIAGYLNSCSFLSWRWGMPQPSLILLVTAEKYIDWVERTPTQKNQGSLGGMDSRHQAGESGKRLCIKRGTALSLFLRGIECQVKPCPGEKKSEQGFCTSHLCIAPQLDKSIKDTKKNFKGMFSWGNKEN